MGKTAWFVVRHAAGNRVAGAACRDASDDGAADGCSGPGRQPRVLRRDRDRRLPIVPVGLFRQQPRPEAGDREPRVLPRAAARGRLTLLRLGFGVRGGLHQHLRLFAWGFVPIGQTIPYKCIMTVPVFKDS
jgi:hypothetical protein